jgi:glycosyltransferase involved in cell wall biosynthesis
VNQVSPVQGRSLRRRFQQPAGAGLGYRNGAATVYRALLGVPVEASGLSQTCWSIVQALSRSGWPVHLHAPALRSGAREAAPDRIRTVLPDVAARLPFDLLRPFLQEFAHRQYLSAIREGEIAYLWPTVPLRTFEAVARRGVPIVTEAVNTRMAKAKEVLDAAYDALGAPPEHGITPERIAMQEARNALCAAIFLPSPAVEVSYRDTHYAARTLTASFGTWVPQFLPDRPVARERPVRFLFVGRDGVRKGLHHLLDAWRQAPANAELRIVGEIPSLLQERFGDVLNLPTVSVAGFVSNMESEYLAADVAVLPSLEEGDPIATYEAASFGIPVIASMQGAGRFGAETGLVTIVEPRDTDALADSIHRFAGDEEMRHDLGARSRAASFAYDWSRVAPARFERLTDFLAR